MNQHPDYILNQINSPKDVKNCKHSITGRYW